MKARKRKGKKAGKRTVTRNVYITNPAPRRKPRRARAATSIAPMRKRRRYKKNPSLTPMVKMILSLIGGSIAAPSLVSKIPTISSTVKNGALTGVSLILGFVMRKNPWVLGACMGGGVIGFRNLVTNAVPQLAGDDYTQDQIEALAGYIYETNPALLGPASFSEMSGPASFAGNETLFGETLFGTQPLI